MACGEICILLHRVNKPLSTQLAYEFYFLNETTREITAITKDKKDITAIDRHANNSKIAAKEIAFL